MSTWDSTRFGEVVGWSPIMAFGLLIIAVILSIFFYGLYNIYLHPLRRFPGPKMWAAYQLPSVVSNFRGQLPLQSLAFHNKYGPVVRIAPNELAFTASAAWKDIQGLQPGRVQNSKDLNVYSIPTPGDRKQIILADDAQHARLRRILAPAFTPMAVDKLTPMLTKYADLLVAKLQLAAEKNKVQDLMAWYHFTTFDLTGEFAFGESFHSLDQGGEWHFFVKTVFDGTIAGLRVMMLDRYYIWTLLKPFLPESLFKAKADMDDYTAALIDKRTEQGFMSTKADVFNYLLENKNLEDQLNRDERIQNALVLVVAGSETTAKLLTGATYHLCKNPGVRDKVTKEVRSAFSTTEDITPQAVNKLEYFIAVLTESLRIFPPSPFGFPRRIDSKGGQVVAGHYVPQNTYCSISHWAASHSATNFARPDDFVPDRWLPDPPAEFANDDHAASQPFHVGPRNCLGKSLAIAEMRVIMAKMLWHFDMELANPEKDDWMEQGRAFLVWGKGPLRIKVTAVER